MTETDSFLAEVLDKQRAAEQALHQGDSEPRMALWSRKDPVTLFGAQLTGTGWIELEPVFREVASWFTETVEWEFEVVAAGASGDLAYTVGYKRSRMTVKGVPGTYTLRVTHVYRREEGEWRHRHGDFPPTRTLPCSLDRPRPPSPGRCRLMATALRRAKLERAQTKNWAIALEIRR